MTPSLARSAGEGWGGGEWLIDCLTSLGRDVQIVIKEAPRRRAGGKHTVITA